MDKIDQILQNIKNAEAIIFDLNSEEYFRKALQHLADISFVAEIEKDTVYLRQVEQVFKIDEQNNKVPYLLSDDEREKLYCSGRLRSIGVWEPYKSVHWSINLKTKYVIAFECTCPDLSKSPKDSFGELYSKSMTRIEGQKAPVIKKREFRADNDSEESELINKVIELFNYSKTHTIPDFNFDAKVAQNMAVYFGTTDDDIMDDIYKETSAPKIIKAPFAYKMIPRTPGLKDSEKIVKLSEKLNNLIKVINGVDYNELDFGELKLNKAPRDYKDFVVETFDNATDAQNVLYSLIEVVNRNPPKPRGTYTEPVLINTLEKHFMSNRWPTFVNTSAEQAEAKWAEKEAEKFAKENTKYIIKATKVLGKVIVWLEVWERGIVYYITNNWDHRVFEEY